MKHYLTALLLHLTALASFGQNAYPAIKISTEPDHIARLKAINRDIWTPFSDAYARGDAAAYMALHTPDFIRANISEVQHLKAYESSSKRHFAFNAERKQRCEISFTFFERVAGADLASERGIYRYTSITATGERTHYYGKFHVIHRLQKGKWRIAVDYDSDEDNSIGQDDYEAALPPDVFEKNSNMPPVTEVTYDSLLAKKLGADDYGMRRYILVLLKTGPANITDKPTVDSLFAGHMSNMGRLAAEGKLILAGPIGRKEKYRGLFVFEAASVEEALTLTATDPAIKAGLLEPECMPYYGSSALKMVNEWHGRLQKKRM